MGWMYNAIQDGIGGIHAGSCENNRRLDLGVNAVEARFHIYQFLTHPERVDRAVRDKYLIESFTYSKAERVAMEEKAKIVNKQKANIRKEIITLKKKIASRVSKETVSRVDAVRVYNELCKGKGNLTSGEDRKMKELIQ